MPYPSQSWMNYLDDSKKLSELTLPGTHDSCTYLTTIDLARCQEMNLEDQFKSGIRFWDIRLKVKGGKMIAYHGPVKLDMTFENILTSSSILLQQFPTECLVMCVSHERNEDNEELYEKLWPVIKDLGNWYKEDRIPQLGEVRGKVVFMRRFRAPLSNFPIGINAYDNWPKNTTKKWESSAGIRFTVQDKYKDFNPFEHYDPGKQNPLDWTRIKFNENVEPVLNEAVSESPAGSRLYINFTSGTPPRPIATVTNQKLLDYLQQHGRAALGIIPMDFPDTSLIRKLIGCNFDPFSKITFQQSTTFENETGGTWTMAPLNQGNSLGGVPAPDTEPALFHIKSTNTPSGRVEIHVVSKEPNYQNRVFESVFKNEDNGTWLVMAHHAQAIFPTKRGALPDLVYIKTKNTPSNKVEVHIASGASLYQEITLQTETCFDCADDGVWTMAQNNLLGMHPDLVYIKTKNTSSKKVEVHIASGATVYRQMLLQVETTFDCEQLGTWTIGGWHGTRDLTLIKTSHTPSGKVEVHTASAESNYQSRTLECTTAFPCETVGTWLIRNFTSTNFSDLILIKTNGTPDNYVALQVASGWR